MKKLICILVMLLATSMPAKADVNMEDVLLASCRVSSENYSDWFNQTKTEKSLGTGTFVAENDTSYFVLTNGHVVQPNSTNFIQTFPNGYESPRIPATIEFRDYDPDGTKDVAILSVQKVHFGNNKPKIIPLAPGDFKLKQGDLVLAGSCPMGQPVMTWKSRVRRNLGNTVSFYHAPLSGQSGSGVITDIPGKGPHVAILLAWRVNNGEYGAGLSIPRVLDIIDGIARSEPIQVNYENINFEPEKVCTNCQHKHKEHYLIPDGAGGYKGRNGSYLWCPGEYAISNGIKLESVQGYCGPFGCYPNRNGQIPPPSDQTPRQVPAPPNNGGGWGGKDLLKTPLLGQEQAQELEDKAKAFKDKIDEQQNIIKGLESTLEDLKSKLSASEKSTQSYLSKISSLEEEVKKGGSKALEAIAEQNKLKELLKKTDNEKSKLLNKVSEVEGLITGLTKEKEQLVSQLDSKGHYLDEMTGGNGNVVENTSLALVAGTAVPLALKYGPLALKALGILRRKEDDEEIPGKSENPPNNPPSGGYNNGGSTWQPPSPQTQPTQPQQVIVENRHSGEVQHIHQGQVSHVYDSDQFAVKSTELPGSVENLDPGFFSYNGGKRYEPVMKPVYGLPPEFPNIPFSSRKTITTEQFLTIWSELVNEYGHDDTMTPMQMNTLLRQRLKQRYGVE